MEPKYKRVILKVSGEALAGESHKGIEQAMLDKVAADVKKLVDMGVQVAMVVGGGNFWRGRTSQNMDRPTADYIGMLATCMNALALRSAFEAAGIPVCVQTAIEMDRVADPFNNKRALKLLDEGTVVIFAGGTGSPFFSTDTTTALRAAEIGADVILLAKNVDAVYDSDPVKNPNARKYKSLTHSQVLEQNLQVMDSTAAAMCRDNNITIHVFGMAEPNGIYRACMGEEIGTIVK